MATVSDSEKQNSEKLDEILRQREADRKAMMAIIGLYAALFLMALASLAVGVYAIRKVDHVQESMVGRAGKGLGDFAEAARTSEPLKKILGALVDAGARAISNLDTQPSGKTKK